MRVYQLAAKLKVDAKELLGLCQQLGYSVNGQLSTISADQKVRLAESVRIKRDAARRERKAKQFISGLAEQSRTTAPLCFRMST